MMTPDLSSLLKEDPNFDYERLSIDILTCMRGELSQRQLSEKLGYSFNQAGKWEGGVTRIKWEDFIHFANVLNPAVEDTFRRFFWTLKGEFNGVNAIQALEKMLSFSSLPDFAETGSLRRWLNGTASPEFSTVLRALDSRPAMMVGWLSSFLDCRKLPTLEKRYALFLLLIEAVLGDPNCVYVNAALHVQAYRELERHDEKLLAQHAACTVKKLRQTLKTLKSLGIVSFDGKKYWPSAFDFSFSALPSAKLRGLTKYTTELAAERYPAAPISIDRTKTPNTSISSVRVVAMSTEASKKVCDLVAKFHHDVADIVKADHLQKGNVQVLLFHSFASNINPPAEQ